MTHPAEAAGIAERLTKAQREALVNFVEIGNDAWGRTTSVIGTTGAVMRALWSRGCVIGGNMYGSRTRSYRFTPLGLAVAHILREQEGK